MPWPWPWPWGKGGGDSPGPTEGLWGVGQPESQRVLHSVQGKSTNYDQTSGEKQETLNQEEARGDSLKMGGTAATHASGMHRQEVENDTEYLTPSDTRHGHAHGRHLRASPAVDFEPTQIPLSFSYSSSLSSLFSLRFRFGPAPLRSRYEVNPPGKCRPRKMPDMSTMSSMSSRGR